MYMILSSDSTKREVQIRELNDQIKPKVSSLQVDWGRVERDGKGYKWLKIMMTEKDSF